MFVKKAGIKTLTQDTAHFNIILNLDLFIFLTNEDVLFSEIFLNV